MCLLTAARRLPGFWTERAHVPSGAYWSAKWAVLLVVLAILASLAAWRRLPPGRRRAPTLRPREPRAAELPRQRVPAARTSARHADDARVGTENDAHGGSGRSVHVSRQPARRGRSVPRDDRRQRRGPELRTTRLLETRVPAAGRMAFVIRRPGDRVTASPASAAASPRGGAHGPRQLVLSARGAARRAAPRAAARRGARARARGCVPASARPGRLRAARGRLAPPRVASERPSTPTTPRRRAALRPSSRLVCACWPPGPLERETLNSTSRDGEGNGARDPNRLTLHGVHSARRRRRAARLRGADPRRRRGGRRGCVKPVTASATSRTTRRRPRARARRGAARARLPGRGRRAADDAARRGPRARRQARLRARHVRRRAGPRRASSSSAKARTRCSSAAATRRSSRTRSSAT